MTDPMAELNQQLKALAARSSAAVPGVRLHPEDIELLPRSEPKPIWAGGSLDHLLGTPVFADGTIERGTHQIATRDWIAAKARERYQDLSSSPANSETKED